MNLSFFSLLITMIVQWLPSLADLLFLLAHSPWSGGDSNSIITVNKQFAYLDKSIKVVLTPLHAVRHAIC